MGYGVLLVPEQLDVAALITERATSFEPLARERGVHLSVETEERALQAYVDPDALRKSIGVLVQNAIEFSEEGDRVRVDAWGRETTLEVTVEDTGIGMDDAMTDEVFEAFRQASRGQSRTHEGPGLGLTVAHRLITLMDGSIEIHSEKGEGTRVVVQLPRRESAPVSA